MNIIIERGRVWKLEELPEYSIALDGAVDCGPMVDIEHHKINFDHHSHCERFSSLATCEQALVAINLGLDPTPYNIYVNDVDADVCLAIYCLNNPDRSKDPLLQKLTDAIGKSDRYAGALAINGMKKTVEWICFPETESKKSGDYEKLSSSGLKSLLESIEYRIELYINGEAGTEITKQSIQEDFKILRNENGWALLETKNSHALGAIWQAGFDRVVLVRKQTDGSNALTFAKRSDFVDGFPLKKIYEEINKMEPGAGGGSSIGGCVRHSDGSRSRLSLETITEIVDKAIQQP